MNEIKVVVDDVEVFSNDEYQGIRISWSGSPGFGEYTIYRAKNSDKWYGDSECMDDNEDKSFLKKLFENFIEQMVIQ